MRNSQGIYAKIHQHNEIKQEKRGSNSLLKVLRACRCIGRAVTRADDSRPVHYSRQLFTLITLMKHLISPRVLQGDGVWSAGISES